MNNSARLLLVFFLSFFVGGCSVVNFSANYYTPPANYQNEILALWKKINAELPLKKSYTFKIINGKDSDRLNGVPAIADQTVLLPEDFIKYVFQNYYDDRHTVFVSVMVHEISHREYNLSSVPPVEHFKTDVQAIALLGADQKTAQDFYKSLFVMKNYWFSRKGMGGHFLNAAWNAANAASLFYGGPSAFADLYATDLSKRMKLIRKNYGFRSKKCFKRSSKVISK